MATLVTALCLAAPPLSYGGAKLLVRPKSEAPRHVLASQKRNLEHARYVCNYGRRHYQRWSCRARLWLRREYRETLAVLRKPYYGIRKPAGSALCGSACISCESGGDPQNWDNWTGKTYWGLYQFDRSTWVAHGGSAGEYGRAPAWRQHQVASRVGYDAWPNC